MSLLLVSHPLSERHMTGAGHPERPLRFRAVEDALEETFPDATRAEAPVAPREALVRVHSERYVDALAEIAPDDSLIALDMDTVMSPHTLDAAYRAAGAVVHAVDEVIAGNASTAFCNVRPPGHHAERESAYGFCFFGNVAIGAKHALDAHGLDRVAVVDFDVHHGNGTEDMCQNEPRAMLCSSFQYPFFPDRFFATDKPNIRNVPLPAGTDGATWRPEVEAAWFDALDAFAPELVFVSAGFDAHADDPMANFHLVEDDFAWITRAVREIAERHSKGRVVSALEGGYDIDALACSAVAHVSALA